MDSPHTSGRRAGYRPFSLYRWAVVDSVLLYTLHTSVCSLCSTGTPHVASPGRETVVWPSWVVGRGMKALFCSLFPPLSPVFLAPRIHSNATLIKHLSECPRNKFQERFAYPISIGVREGKLGGAFTWQGNQLALKGSEKNQFLRKFLLIQSYSTLCLAQPRVTSSFSS